MSSFYSKQIHDRKKKLIIVEDEVLSAADMAAFLSGKGFDVCATAVNSEDAYEAAEKNLPDLILMDIRIKGEKDGIETAIEIRKTLGIPIIFITAYADRLTLERAKDADPYGYILKPFAEHDLYATVEMAINKREIELANSAREVWFSTILTNIGDGVIVFDEALNVIYSNNAAREITGFDNRDFSEKGLLELLTLKREDLVVTDQIEGILFRSGRVLRKNGHEIDIEFNNARVPAESGFTGGNIIVFRDITERVKSEIQTKKTLSMLRKAMGGVIQSMAATVETRDPYTAGHQKRVTELARRIAEEMNLNEEIKDGIRMAGLIHDIGKISVPAEILSKPGKLSDIEFNLIKTHPQAGFEILKNIEFPWPVAMIVKQHHERYNGSGYPDGLKGNDILIEARVIAVADVVEAMASHRPYRASLGINFALEEIINNKRKFYDPDVVDACVSVFSSGNFVFEGGSF